MTNTGHYEPAQRKLAQQNQQRIRNAETQAIVSRAIAKNARYTFWAAILASAAALLTAAAAVYCVLTRFPFASH
jgi:hypothetical protein